MRLRWKEWMAVALLLAPLAGRAASCTAQAELGSLDRDALLAIAGKLANAVTAQDFNTLQSNLLPEEAQEWSGMRAAVEQAAPLARGCDRLAQVPRSHGPSPHWRFHVRKQPGTYQQFSNC